LLVRWLRPSAGLGWLCVSQVTAQWLHATVSDRALEVSFGSRRGQWPPFSPALRAVPNDCVDRHLSKYCVKQTCFVASPRSPSCRCTCLMRSLPLTVLCCLCSAVGCAVGAVTAGAGEKKTAGTDNSASGDMRGPAPLHLSMNFHESPPCRHSSGPCGRVSIRLAP